MTKELSLGTPEYVAAIVFLIGLFLVVNWSWYNGTRPATRFRILGDEIMAAGRLLGEESSYRTGDIDGILVASAQAELERLRGKLLKLGVNLKVVNRSFGWGWRSDLITLAGYVGADDLKGAKKAISERNVVTRVKK